MIGSSAARDQAHGIDLGYLLARHTASARVLEKAGFEFEGILRRWDLHPNLGDGRRDALGYGRIA